ncbi:MULTISPECIES: hypothetical protein [unclassified Bradyrhizobium]|uniref:hypothetical protein n=1 Tax=unclassified Bradyrhizobium TaxID=2631580 RepID=UPI0028E70192|nr:MULTISPECIES: hypothetical protein [unclassified Bradyrhizobium]
MALTIICLCGPANTGKSSSIREFTARCLEYRREGAARDVLGIFRLPIRKYAVGVSSRGDTPGQIKQGRDFLLKYSGLRVMIVACHPSGATRREIDRLAAREKVTPVFIETNKLKSRRDQDRAIEANVAAMWGLMPRSRN